MEVTLWRYILFLRISHTPVPVISLLGWSQFKIVQFATILIPGCGHPGPVSLTLLITKHISKDFIAKSANVARILSYRFGSI